MRKNEPGWALVKASSGGHSFGSRFQVFRNPNFSKLIQAVDKFQGTATPETIRSLAISYGDTEKMVRHLFETKKERETAKETRRIPFDEAEHKLVRKLRNQGETISSIKKELNKLSVNRERGISRSERSVKAILSIDKNKEGG